MNKTKIIFTLSAVAVIIFILLFFVRSMPEPELTVQELEGHEYWGEACIQARFQYNCSISLIGNMIIQNKPKNITFLEACHNVHRDNLDVQECAEQCGC